VGRFDCKAAELYVDLAVLIAPREERTRNHVELPLGGLRISWGDS
jgi:hypothetical protein